MPMCLWSFLLPWWPPKWAFIFIWKCKVCCSSGPPVGGAAEEGHMFGTRFGELICKNWKCQWKQWTWCFCLIKNQKYFPKPSKCRCLFLQINSWFISLVLQQSHFFRNHCLLQSYYKFMSCQRSTGLISVSLLCKETLFFIYIVKLST